MTEKEFEGVLKGLADEMRDTKMTIMEFDSFKRDTFKQNQMISNRLLVISDILNKLRAEIETIDAALIKE